MIIKEVVVGKSGVIPKASYSNLRPNYTLTMQVDEDDDIDEVIFKAKSIVEKHFELDEYRAKVDLLQKQFKTFRFYDAPEGLKYPSINTILGYQKEWQISKGELVQYGSMGTINHVVFWDTLKNFKKTGEIIWKEPTEFPELEKEVGIVKNGSLGLDWNDYSYKAFGEKYIPSIGEIYCIEHPLLNQEIKVGGTVDMIAEFEGELCVIDLKTGGYDFQQLVFYGRTWEKLNEKKIQNMVVFPLGRTDNKQGYMRPIKDNRFDYHWDNMLEIRQQFKEDFDV